MQRAYINAYEHLQSFEGRSRFATWLTRIVINEAMGKARQKSRSTVLEPRIDEDGEGPWTLQLASPVQDNPAERLMNEELRSVLERTIDALPDKYRSVFVMREVEGMSIAETGESLGISPANVKVRLNRAKEMLRQRIGTEYRDAGVYHFDLVRCDRVVAGVMARVQRYGPEGMQRFRRGE
jgi:RNA polymerase sigma-70 factor (ECF subfamily)